jgi:hypothetical protein
VRVRHLNQAVRAKANPRVKANLQGKLVLQAPARKARDKRKLVLQARVRKARVKAKLMHPNRIRIQAIPLPVRVRRTRLARDRRILLVLALALVQAVNSVLFPSLRVLKVQAMGKDLRVKPQLNKQAQGRARILAKVLVVGLVFPLGSKVQSKVAIAQQVT